MKTPWYNHTTEHYSAIIEKKWWHLRQHGWSEEFSYWGKSETKRQIAYHIQVGSVNSYRWTEVQNRNRLSDWENQIMIKRKLRGRGKLRVSDEYIHTNIYQIDNHIGLTEYNQELNWKKTVITYTRKKWKKSRYTSPVLLILLTVPTVSLYLCSLNAIRWTHGRQGMRGELQEDTRSCRNCRHIYSLLAGAAAIT